MNSTPGKVDVDRIISDYNIDAESTRPVKVYSASPTTKVFKVEKPELIEELYIIDTAQGKDIACHPHIVGETLKRLAFGAALEAARTVEQHAGLSEIGRDSVVFENVLRAAPGYELHAAFRELNRGRGFRDVWVRPCYERPSYRSHDEESSVRLDVIYEDFGTLPPNTEITVLKPDTEATGRTGQKSIERIMEQCETVGSTVRKVILYGFISSSGLKAINKTAESHEIELAAFSIGSITDLAHNGYDMTLYGVDESLWRVNRRIRKLGSITDVTTLERYLPEFVPGLDQPGDWSNRQTSVHITKDRKEPGNIKAHLENSGKLIKSLMRISNYEPWQEEIARSELRLLHRALQEC